VVPVPHRRIALIVDDDVELAAMTAMAIGSQGWHTIVTSAPVDAASIASDLPIDLLVTDLNMPGMSGMELAARVRERRAGLPVVLVSGSPEAAIMTFEPPFTFIAKPFSLHALFDAINALACGGTGAKSPPA
jgi:DNA-binding response OmpR family regulator